MPERPPPIQQLFFRAQAARQAPTNEPLSQVVDALVGQLSRRLDVLGHRQEGGAYSEVFLALATAADVAEALSRKRRA